MVDTHRNLARKRARGGAAEAGGAAGGSLFGRVGQQQRSAGPVGAAGLRVINGKLVRADDVGAQLREFNRAHAGTGRRARRARRVPRETRAVFSSSNYDDGAGRRRLVVSLRSGAQFLTIRNLPIGSRPERLKQVIEAQGLGRVAHLQTLDLASGSAVAEVHVAGADGVRTLQQLVQRFHGAEIDGRRVTAEISSISELQPQP
ncbi:AFR060Cp [Eremothecium gossypii ATCC 10895]|uniref:AFR060Cp n=1 Tax=Eremothecium gossypii (strain ATCC 10895 / CBS 109.51 / FGSC 9923 / NRRL Y-1056) TaxID=284811 RepID=Q754L2_EREGS|nr:AFR060Cp [Eremothecium gossypii ATCC 10895]AAS53431.1 AFR060Cp [Eremothecium gossypii ATCC 10895]AEY97743.1 FAFR060Cp [Eremothecium gossypii FDAG1]